MTKMRVHIARNNIKDKNGVTWQVPNDIFLLAYKNLIGQELRDNENVICTSVVQDGDIVYGIFSVPEKNLGKLGGLFVNTRVEGVLQQSGLVTEIKENAELLGLSVNHADEGAIGFTEIKEEK